MRILVVEDERSLAGTLADILGRERYLVDLAYDGEEGLDCALSGIYDGMILDVMLPKLSGFEVLRRLRQSGSALPVLMLTARSELSDRVAGLDAGADYYLTKPFEREELLACLRAILRRPTEVAPATLCFGDLELGEESGQLCCGGQSVQLGAKECQLMRLLMAAGGAGIIPTSLLDPVRPMPASIAAEMAEAPFRSDHYHALFAIGIVLFFLTLAFNLIASRIAEKHRQAGSSSL